MNALAAESAVAAKADQASALANQVGGQRSTNEFYLRVEQFLVSDSANVILAENSRIEHSKYSE